ncbi:unnamed protein product [Arctogadus glacialis]
MLQCRATEATRPVIINSRYEDRGPWILILVSLNLIRPIPANHRVAMVDRNMTDTCDLHYQRLFSKLGQFVGSSVTFYPDEWTF